MILSKEDLVVIDNFIHKDNPKEMTERECQAVVKMQCEIFEMLSVLVIQASNTSLLKAPSKGPLQ